MSHARYHLALLVAALCYAFVGIFVKKIVGMPIMAVTFFRMFVGTMFLLMLVPRIDKTVFTGKTMDLKDNLLIGFLLAVTVSAYNSAFLFASVTRVALVNASYILFTVIFAYMFLGETLRRREIMVLSIGAIGILFLQPTGQVKMIGFVLALLSGFSYALALVYIRKEEKQHTVGTVFWYILFAALFLLPFPFLHGVGNIGANIWYLLGLGVLSTGLAYFLLNYSLRALNADYVAMFLVLCVPLLAMFFSSLLLHEHLGFLEYFGGALLITSALILEWQKKPSKHVPKGH